MAQSDHLSSATLSNLQIIERVSSSVSVLGCAFILATFWFCKSFNRPINRIIAYASAGNLVTNVATMMAGAPRTLGSNSFLCQAQGFLIQAFMGADVLWTLCMAINVYLTFYHKFDADRLRKIEKWYFLACYGIPLIPAVTFLFAQAHGGGRIYGDSQLWCWVSEEYSYLRIGCFYAPIWLVILVTGGIYLRAGREIWRKRRNLTRMINAGVKNYGDHQLNPYDIDGGMIYDLEGDQDGNGKSHPVVNVNMLGRTLTAADGRYRTMPLNEEVVITSEITTTIEEPEAAHPKPTYEYQIGTMPMFPSRPKAPKKKKGARGAGKGTSAAKNSQTKHEEMSEQDIRRQISHDPSRTLVAYQANRAAWSYTKVSAMFFLAMLITYVPSSANRLYSAVNAGDISIPLTYACAFVLPLQGMWNCIIYCITSSQALSQLRTSLGSTWRRKKSDAREHREKEEDEIRMKDWPGKSEDLESGLGSRNQRPKSKYSSMTDATIYEEDSETVVTGH